MNKRKILLVDDDANLVASIARNIRRIYEVVTATSGIQALALLKANPDVAVIISDMHMPEMNGATFLKLARKANPKPIRLLLTGGTDLELAMRAVNEGEIFRFLSKPCPTSELILAIDAAIRQLELEESQKILLEKTLLGCIKVLCEVLSMNNSRAFKASVRVKDYVRHLCRELRVTDGWKYDVAALLSHLGLMTLTSEAMDQIEMGEELSVDDQTAYSMHPYISEQFISRIPQLELVAEIVAEQDAPLADFESLKDPSRWSPVKLGSQMLRTAIAFDRLIRCQSLAISVASEKLHALGHNHIIVNLLAAHLHAQHSDWLILKLDELLPGHVIEEDICTVAGTVIIPKGHELNEILISRVKNHNMKIAINEPIKVRKDPSSAGNS